MIVTLSLAFMTGLISSFGHCLGMCGGIVALYSARQAAPVAAGSPPPNLWTRTTSLIPLHVGRITTYNMRAFGPGTVPILLRFASRQT